MDKYRRGEKKATDQDAATLPNEVRITKFGNVHGYVSYATNLLTPADKATTSGDIVLKAMGNAISKAVTVAEILKHRIPNIHTVTNILSVETEDVYEPLEEGLDVVTTVRRIPSISIQLALNVSLVNLNASGYQKPIPVDQVNPESDGVTNVYDGDDSRQTRGGGRGRKPRGRSGRGGGRGRGGDVAVEEGETAAVGGYAAESGENGESRAPKARRARAKKNVVTASGAPEVSENATAAAETTNEEATGRGSRGGRGSRNGRGRGRGIGAVDDDAQDAGGRGGRSGGRGNRSRRGPKPAGDDAQVEHSGYAVEVAAENGAVASSASVPRARTSSASSVGAGGRGNGGRSQSRGGRGEGKLFADQ
ncbi:DNA-binding protein Alba [Aphanomyces astaci]|uniref:DNA-binding protein Alba n=1 Tax=Aphanomyces astaci TaxID=112090 RepID=W4GNT0_APHAT|nr:DNA-binding protein Alba [Aphanomyces astaci]ETV81375.1 DNA-binding protein Alba [Aphanomyces astaci]|eukprot:XP_009829233.1 DNA-binding protein Alba [Aphanomyces astaci]